MTEQELRQAREAISRAARAARELGDALAALAGQPATIAPAALEIPAILPGSPAPAGQPAPPVSQAANDPQYAETVPPARFQPPSSLPPAPPMPADMAAPVPAAFQPADGWTVRELSASERNRFGYDYPQSEAPAWIAQGGGFFLYGPTREAVVVQARAQGAKI